MKAIIVASVASMIDQFNRTNIDVLQELGYDVEVGCNFEVGNTCNEEKIEALKNDLKNQGVGIHQIDFSRNITQIGNNIMAYKQLKEVARSSQYDLMHCHSPIGGLLGRIAFQSFRKKGTRTIYTAHGFHFYKGAPIKNWIIYYPIERIASRLTDVLVTINQEDYEFAKKRMKARQTVYIPGVGIDVDYYSRVRADRASKLKEFSIDKNDIVLLSVGELNENKNHRVVLEALSKLNNRGIQYIIAGRGDKQLYLEKLAKKLGLSDKVHLIGFRTDIAELYKSVDVLVHPSYREGLSVAVMEALASGLPVIGSRIRGNVDLIEETVNGELFDPRYSDSLASLLRNIDRIKKEKEGIDCKFSISGVKEALKAIYS